MNGFAAQSAMVHCAQQCTGPALHWQTLKTAVRVKQAKDHSFSPRIQPHGRFLKTFVLGPKIFLVC